MNKKIKKTQLPAWPELSNGWPHWLPHWLPELRAKCENEKKLARKAKQFTVQKLREAKVIVLKSVQRGKYFRIVADVYLDGVPLSNQLLDHKLAVAYSGGKKIHDWCNIKL